MGLLQLLLFAILITLLGWWSGVGILMLIVVAIIIFLVATYFGLLGFGRAWGGVSKKLSPERKEQVYYRFVAIVAIIGVATLSQFWSADKSDNRQIDFQPLTQEQYEKVRSEGFSPEEIVEMEKVRKVANTETTYKYFLKDTTNVRSCGSLDCKVVGQYPAGTEFEFQKAPIELSEWEEITWIDNGITQHGFIHKSNLRWSVYNSR